MDLLGQFLDLATSRLEAGRHRQETQLASRSQRERASPAGTTDRLESAEDAAVVAPETYAPEAPRRFRGR